VARRKRGKWQKRLRVFADAAQPYVLRGLALLVMAGVLIPPLAMAVFAVVSVPITPVMMVRQAEGEGLVRVPVPLREIAPALVRAVIASEDTRFCLHDGFDWNAIGKASKENAEGTKLRGASTISQQTAKNVLLWPGRDWLRKGLEAYTTFFMERLWSKGRIMETYLNIAEWGPGLYGAEAAARFHFGKTAGTLSDEEAARLAVILPDPRRWPANKPTGYVAERARTILARMDEVKAQGLARCVLPRTPSSR
jgi:monofunctional biosynthetic peptidoglycan transglycosylase